MQATQSWHARIRLTAESLPALKAGDNQLSSRIEAALATGRTIWISGDVSLRESGVRFAGTGDRKLFRGGGLSFNTSLRDIGPGDQGPLTDNVALIVNGRMVQLSMSRRHARELLEAARHRAMR